MQALKKIQKWVKRKPLPSYSMHFVSLRAWPVDGKRSVKSPPFVDLRVEASAFPQFGIRPGSGQWGWDLLLPPPYVAPPHPLPRLDRLPSTSQGWKRGQRREQSYELEWFQARVLQASSFCRSTSSVSPWPTITLSSPTVYSMWDSSVGIISPIRLVL